MHQEAGAVIMTDVPRPPRIPYLRVADALRERLDHGEWLPGEQLPSARQLGAEYGVNPSTAARAVRVLADEGRVNIIPAWGAFEAEG
jgi:DNA-binding GntR family transcriptional regulator